MRIASVTFVSLLFLIAATTFSFVHSHGSYNAAVGCNQIEREALMKFKDELQDPSKRLASWGADAECCTWHGVICDNFTGHVTELHLKILSSEEYYSSSDALGYYFYEEYLERSSFRGKVSQSLLNLKHLNYLDLSNNDFGGIQIPPFLGSMESLRHLNLYGAGFGGRIPHQLGNLSNLQYLNLNAKSIYTSAVIYIESLQWLSSLRSLEFLDFSGVDLSKAFNWLDVLNTLPSLGELHLSGSELYPIPLLSNVNFSSLLTLNLSANNFVVPSWIFRLTTLATLDLSSNNFVGSIPIHLQNITTLRELYLSDSGLNSSIFNCLHGLAHLELLHLASNYNLDGKIPSTIGNLTSLRSLDLSFNSLEEGIPSAIGNLTSLKSLDLSRNSLEGDIPSAIGNLASLSSLDLSRNSLEGGIPTWFRNLCNLRSLELSINKLSQEINEVFEILSGCVSDILESLILPSSQLSGHLSDRLVKFKNLAYLDLNDNLISGPIPENLGELNFLISLDLGNNKLNGSLPIDFGMLSKLNYVDISNNSLEGEISEIHFANLTNLATFKASSNQLRLRVSPDWFPAFQRVSTISLKCWKVGPQFPTWIHSLKYLAYLDLSNSTISSTLPTWFHNFSSRLYQINLSHNQMHGTIPYLSIDDSDYSLIDLSSNNFGGSMPFISSNPFGLDLSNNSFSGSISSFLCYKPRTINVLNLGENLFSGEIPDCWMNWNYTNVIRLSNNYFSGNIPESIGTLSELSVLNIRNNNLSGEMPISLKHCTSLQVLDLSGNELSGEITTWMGQHFQGTLILNLRGNKFHGFIPEELCGMTALVILDFANNNLNGTIPRCINNFTALLSGTSYLKDGKVLVDYGPTLTYSESSLIERNGKLVEYSTTLGFVRSLDFSNNKLSGEIPEEMTSLRGLLFLNLSHNSLTGRIPENIGAMKALQILDFSRNQLSGEIPQSMSSLTFLNNLNLSSNKLSGIIPSSTQLQSFDSSSFSGNNLCGPPLTQSCSGDGEKPDIEKRTTEDGGNGSPEAIDWFYFYVSIAPGFVIGFWVVVGPLAFNKRWRRLYFNFLEDLWNKIWVWFYVHIVNRRRF
ncbi:leucine-rich repeat receptor protein kinase exs precursor, putative [Ricinus communis]|uniref:Leucine-rich repeat receptor protein kinase exs, putative n=1 Tax=Ricinus communis TaxID=3988 RepID=B9T0F6_RICCO|nr:leucine-rich repeat receptor protein kinase exs precursor, putative [Ricinus communis]|eukprot:XP_025015320.1 receptor-like protein EIX2 [Ricinus communis]